MIAHQLLHAAVFGSHAHNCSSARCNGREFDCSDPNDCQPGPRLCQTCVILDEYLEDQRIAWRQVDRVAQKAVGV